MENKLKICHIGWAHSIHVERLMLWLLSEGHDVSIITDKPKKIDGIRMYVVDGESNRVSGNGRNRTMGPGKYMKWFSLHNRISRVNKIINEISPDIIHSHSLWYPGYLGYYVKGYPFVVTVLNGDVLWEKSNIDFFTKIRTKRAIRKADVITGESQVLIDACVKHGAEPDKTHITRGWGVDLARFNPCADKERVRNNLGLPQGSKIILSPRSTGSYYNLRNIMAAAPEILEKTENAFFVFIWHGGSPDRVRELKSMAGQLGVEKSVRFVGPVDHDKVALYHKASDLMVSVSSYDSGPVALQEAMACGDVPVISDLPSVREWITDGWNGILVDPGNVGQIAGSVITLLNNEEMRSKFSDRNWELIQEKGSQDYWVKKMENIYYSLLEATK